MKFYGQFADPAVDQYLYEEFFKFTTNGFFIECGAANGIADSSCKFFEEFLEWKGINIEAHPEIFSQLQKNRPNSINLNCALTSPEEDGEILKFNAYNFKDGCSLISEFGKHAPIGYLDSAKNYREEIKTAGTLINAAGQLKIKGISYSSLIKNNDIKNVDLFVLDVEGSELDVIKGMKGCKVLPKIIYLERPPDWMWDAVLQGTDRAPRSILADMDPINPPPLVF